MKLRCMQCGEELASWEQIGDHVRDVHPDAQQVDIRVIPDDD